MKKSLHKIGAFFDVQSWGTLLILSIAVGLCSGIAACLFEVLLEFLHMGLIGRAEGITDPGRSRFWIVILPLLGGLVSGILVFTLAPEASGGGTDEMIRGFHRLRGVIRARVPFLKAVTAAITIGSGGSAGKEGPIALIGAGLSSILSSRLKLDPGMRRVLLIAGAGAGIGAIFRAPLGGALFAAEVLYRDTDIEYEAIVPSVAASITAYAIITGVLGHGYLFTGVQDLQFSHSTDLILYAALGLICSVMGFLYLRTYSGIKSLVFQRMPIPAMWRPAVGGLLLGILALWLPQVLAGGYQYIQLAIDNQLAGSDVPLRAFQFLLVLALAKMVAVSFTIGSGGSGGVFAPTLFIGAMIGGGFGYLIQAVAPGMIDESTRISLILVGMGGFFAGVAKVPMASLIMITEMTGSYGLIVPLMVTCTLAFMLSRRWTLYDEQVPGKADSPAHLGDFVLNVMENIPVREALIDGHKKFHTLREDSPLKEISELFRESYQPIFPVVDDRERMVGVLSMEDVQAVINDDLLGNLMLAGEMCTSSVHTCTPDDDLYQVLRAMRRLDVEALPVVNRLDDRLVLAIISRKDVILAYERKLNDLRRETGQVEPTEIAPAPYRTDSVLAEIKVHAGDANLCHRQVLDVAFPPGTLLVSIQRGTETIIPRGATWIEEDDLLLVLTKRGDEESVRKALTSQDSS